MEPQELKNKPLVEAIFELRWALQPKGPGMVADPHYRLLLGRLYDRLQSAYPEHEQLETARIPDEMVGHRPQHRFRTAKDDWPLVQLGPGLYSVNDTQKYTWNDFRARVLQAITKFYEAYPKPADLQVESLTLRYIDAVDLDYQSLSVFNFLKEKLKVSVSLPPGLFEGTEVEPLPQQFQSQQTYRSKRPPGAIDLRFATGQRSSKSALIWQTIFQSAREDLPNMVSGFEAWLDQAHTLTDDWFFKMIEGELHRRFSGE